MHFKCTARNTVFVLGFQQIILANCNEFLSIIYCVKCIRSVFFYVFFCVWEKIDRMSWKSCKVNKSQEPFWHTFFGSIRSSKAFCCIKKRFQHVVLELKLMFFFRCIRSNEHSHCKMHVMAINLINPCNLI